MRNRTLWHGAVSRPRPSARKYSVHSPAPWTSPERLISSPATYPPVCSQGRYAAGSPVGRGDSGRAGLPEKLRQHACHIVRPLFAVPKRVSVEICDNRMNLAYAEPTVGAPPDELPVTGQQVLALLAASTATGDARWANELLALLQQRHWSAVVTRLSELAPATHTDAQRELLQGIIECLPEEVLCAHPPVAAWLGALLLASDLHRALAAWERAHHAFSHERNWSGCAMVVANAVQAVLADARELERLDAWLERGASLLLCKRTVAPAIWLRFCATMTAAVCHRQPECKHLADYNVALNLAVHGATVNATQGLSAAASALNVATWSGDVATASELQELAQRWVAATDAEVTALAAYYVSRIFYASFAVDTAIAQRCYDDLANLKNARVRSMLNAGQLNLAHAYASAGHWRRATSILDDVQRNIGAGRSVDWAVFFVLRAWIALGEGRAAIAVDFSQHACQAAEAGGTRRAQALALMARSTALADTGAWERARHTALLAKQCFGGFETPLFAFHMACVVAYAQLAGNQALPAAEALREAFGLGRRHRLLNNLLWLPHMMSRLCDAALMQGIEAEYAAELARDRALRPYSNTSDAWPWRIKIYCLGAFRVLKDNAPLMFKGKAQQRPLDLLKALIAHGGRDVHTTRLADALWGDSDADGAQNTFDSTLHRLRKLLDCDEAVILSEGKLSLNSEYCWLDTWSFEQDVPAPHGSRPAIHTLQQYRGRFLAKEAEQPWMIAYRERLHSRYLRAVRAAGAQLETEARWHDAIDVYERALDVDPTAEVGYAQLMYCYCQIGYRAEALNIYHRCRNTLAAVLGVPPSPAIERLYRQLQQR